MEEENERPAAIAAGLFSGGPVLHEGDLDE